MSDDMTRLPYDFDLLYDIKYMYQVERVCKGLPTGSSATPRELRELFIDLEMELPDFLIEACKGYPEEKTIWVCNDGSWITYEPCYEERYKYVKTTIVLSDEFKSGLRVEL